MHKIDQQPFPRSGIQTLDRCGLLIDLVARSGDQGMTAAQLEEVAGLSIATVYRLVQALRRLGMLRQTSSRGPYLLGHQLIVWGSTAGQTQGLRQAARAPLLRLAQQFQDSFFLFVPDGYNVLCLDIQEGDYPARSYARHIGGRIRYGIGQGSVAILSHLSASEYEEVLDKNMPGLQRSYGISRHDIDAAVAMCRHLNITSGVEGTDPPEFTGIACPILDSEGYPVAAISCSLRRSRMSGNHYTALCDGLRQQSLLLQQQLYGEPGAT